MTSQPWLKECEEYRKMLWETYRNGRQVMRRASQAVQRVVHAVESHEHLVHAVWEESAQWAEAWQHTRVDTNARKQYTWMQKTLQHYRTKQETLWPKASKEGREGVKKRRRMK